LEISARGRHDSAVIAGSSIKPLAELSFARGFVLAKKYKKAHFKRKNYTDFSLLRNQLFGVRRCFADFIYQILLFQNTFLPAQIFYKTIIGKILSNVSEYEKFLHNVIAQKFGRENFAFI
jgi:hypothetical protein